MQTFSQKNDHDLDTCRKKKREVGREERGMEGEREKGRYLYGWASQVVLVVKNLPVNAGDTGSIPESGRFPGKGNGHPLQYSCLE